MCYLAGRDTLGCYVMLSVGRYNLKVHSNIATSQPAIRNQICNSRDQLLVHCSILHKISFRQEKSLSSSWNLSIPRKVNFYREPLEMRDVLLTRAVSTLDTKYSFRDEHEQRDDHRLLLETDSNPEAFEDSGQTSAKMAERERLRRMRISKANKGNVPWNKGRRHSAETLRRIRERTKLAMQDPKVKMKLVNLGHAQSVETRKKIGVGVRMGWQRRREKLMVQETCWFEWQNLIAEASRRGYAGEETLQWDSYEMLDKQLEHEWLKSIEQRKSMPRPKGNKRAPKSPEQRRKISMAISAKWSDPEYRGRVCSALAKYHGTPTGAKRRPPRRRPVEDGHSVKSFVKRKVRGSSDDTGIERKSKAQSRPKRSVPLYKDPLTDSKLEMIKNIRAQRMAMETKKTEAMERAKLLISEAEKAAKSLEEAAVKSPLAHASLMETRKLIAEATRSIEAVETGQIVSQKDDNYSSSELSGLVNHYEKLSDRENGGLIPPDTKEVNGTRALLRSNEGSTDFDFGKYAVQNLLNRGQHVETRSESRVSWPLQPDIGVNGRKELVGPVEANEAVEKGRTPVQSGEETGPPLTTDTTNSTKKWVCGRLVEVTED